jgi:peptidoglycan hydrolase-like amidase
MGARTRALNGQTYREILDAYYTDTELRRLY